MSSKLMKFESLLESVQGALVGMDPLGGIRFVNHRAELLFGYNRDDLVGRHIVTGAQFDRISSRISAN